MELSRLVNREIVRPIRHGVYAMAGVPSGALEDVRAEWLATDPARTAGDRHDDLDQVVVSDETAALVHGVGDLPQGGVHLSAARRLQTRQRSVDVVTSEVLARVVPQLAVPVSHAGLRQRLKDDAKRRGVDPHDA